MITKAIIQNNNLLNVSDNKYFVRIPIFEAPGQVNPYIVKATLSYQPGNLEAYLPGDVVYVTFENNEISRPVIIGKLYIGDENKPTNFSNDAKLNVTESAHLPIDTSVADLSSQEVYEALKNSKPNEERIARNEQSIIRIFNILNQGGGGGGGDSHITGLDVTIDW